MQGFEVKGFDEEESADVKSVEATGHQIIPFIFDTFGANRFTAEEAQKIFNAKYPESSLKAYFVGGLRWLAEEGRIGYDPQTETYFDKDAA